MVDTRNVEATNHPLTMLSVFTYKIGPTFYYSTVTYINISIQKWYTCDKTNPIYYNLDTQLLFGFRQQNYSHSLDPKLFGSV